MPLTYKENTKLNYIIKLIEWNSIKRKRGQSPGGAGSQQLTITIMNKHVNDERRTLVTRGRRNPQNGRQKGKDQQRSETSPKTAIKRQEGK